MSTQHTPGPWKFILSESGVRNNGGFICFLPKPTRYTGQDQRYEEETKEWECNALLIAAAPELLEALQGFVEIGKRNMENPKYDGYFEAARAAISKATGN